MICRPFDLGKPHTQSAQQAGLGMIDDPLHIEQLGDLADMLTGCSSETDQRMLTGIGSLLDADGSYSRSHLFVGDSSQAVYESLAVHRFKQAIAPNLFEQFGQTLLGSCPLQRDRKGLWVDPSFEQVQVGNRQRSAAAITSRPWIGSCTFGTDAKLDTVKVTDATTSRGHGVDRQGWNRHSNPGFDRLMLKLQSAIDAADIGRGASHVESDQLRRTALFGDGLQSHRASGRTR